MRPPSLVYWFIILCFHSTFLFAQNSDFKYYTVQPGNTLYSIARENGTSVGEIMKWNHLSSNQLNVGQKLIVGYSGGNQKSVQQQASEPQQPIDDKQPEEKNDEPETKDVQEQGTENADGDTPGYKFHIVQKGNTLYSLSKEYGVFMADILKWNNMLSNQISIGQKLIVGYTNEPEEEVQPPKNLQAEESEKQKEVVVQETQKQESIIREPVIHIVQPGNTIYSIASKYKVPAVNIRNWNKLPNNQLTVGQKIIVGFTEHKIGEEPAAKKEDEIPPVVQNEKPKQETVLTEPVADLKTDTVISEITQPTVVSDTTKTNEYPEEKSFAERGLEAYKKNKVFKVSGKLSAQLGAYDSWGTASRRDNFTYLFTGNVTINIAGIAIPFSAVVSQQEAKFMQPFNQFGASPNYKWITLHAGYRSLQYSPFTLNGHLFLGAGVDLNPRIKDSGWKLRLSAMGGRFRRAVDVDTANTASMPAYKRTGGAFKIGVEKNGNFIDLIFLKAKDDANSISFDENAYTVLPEENLVLGISGQQYLFKKKISVKADLAGSAYTRDTRSVESADGAGKFYSKLGFTARESSHYDYALKTEAAYHAKKYSVGLAYGRITGDYQSMGSYYFQNDVADITGNFNSTLLQGKASLSASLGGQWTNLSNEKTTTNKRIIASLNFSHQLTEKFNYNFNLSNFSSFLQFTRDEDSDSLNLYQVSQNYSLAMNYNLGKKGRGDHSINFSNAYQIAQQRQEYEISKDVTHFYNFSLGHSVTFSKPGISLSSSFNFSTNKSSLFKSSNFGPSASLSKQLLKKKMRLSYNFSLLASRDDSGSSGSFWRNTISCNYKLSKHHAFNAGIYHFTRKGDARPFTELRGEVRYDFTF